MKKVLIQDIAREMGLSRNTIAKALKDDESVLEATRRKIVGKAFEMGYGKLTKEAIENLEREKREAAPAIKKYVIVMGDYSADDFWNGIVVGISERISKSNGSCLINFVSPEDEENLALPTSMLNDDIEGVICLTVFSRKYAAKIVDLGIPVVFLDSPVRKLPYKQTSDIIMIEGMQSIYEITVDLIGRGCEKLGFIGDITYCQSIYDRWLGFERAVLDKGLELYPDFCLLKSKGSRYFPKDVIERELDAMQRLPDAFVCANDSIAIEVMQYCRKRGVAVPKELAITGFDNKKEGMIMEPHITTVNTTNRRIGIRVAEQLLWRIRNPQMHKEVVTVSTEPYIRESSER